MLRNSDEEKYFLIILEFWSYNKLLCDSNYFLKKFKKLCSKLIQVKIICNNGRVNYPLKTFPKKELYVTPQCVCNYVIYNKKPDIWMCRNEAWTIEWNLLEPALLDDNKPRDGDACGASWNISNTFTDASGSYLEEYIQHKS